MSEQAKGDRGGAAVSRRAFVAGAAAAATVAIVKPGAVRGAESNSRVTVGCVGLGGRGLWLARMVAGHAGYRITAVADYFPKTADRAGEQLKVAKERRFSGLGGYKKLIDSKVDAVFLETPPWFFPLHAERAVAAGCHVYMAKPVAVDVPGCLAIARCGAKSTANKRVFLVDFQTRTDPFFIEAIRRAHAGALGKIGMLSSFYTDESFSDPPKTKTIAPRLRGLIWVNDVDLGGGYLVNAGIHAVDVGLWIAGKTPVSAIGAARRGRPNPHGDSNDLYSITYEFDGGLIMNHRGEHIRNRHGFSCGCDAYGQGAYLASDYTGKSKTWIYGGKMQYPGGEAKGLYGAGAQRNIETFHKNITGAVYDNVTVTPSVNSTLATILGREAGRKAARITWAEMIKANRTIGLDLTGLQA